LGPTPGPDKLFWVDRDDSFSLQDVIAMATKTVTRYGRCLLKQLVFFIEFLIVDKDAFAKAYYRNFWTN